MREPARFQALTQPQPRPMQHHEAVGRSDVGFLTDPVGIPFEPLAHHENPAQRRGQVFHAHLQDVEELHAGVSGLGITPVQRLVDPMAILCEQLVEGLDLGRLGSGLDRHFAPAAPELVDDLVLQDPDHPRLQL